jgi:abequosyltransferase
MRSERPLITIAIPTFNRAKHLEQLLFCLSPQLGAHSEVELLVSDNASTDSTPSVVAQLRSQSKTLRYVRNEVNIGPDANFLQCFEQARGKYVWLIGDDDLIAPRSLDKLTALLRNSDYALAYLSPYPLTENGSPERERDRFGRFAQRVENGSKFIQVVGPMITFISSVIVNKERYASLHSADPKELVGTNLIQLAWCLPVLASGGQSLIVWDKILEARVGNSGGYGVCRVFSENLNELLIRTVPDRKDIRNSLVNSNLRGWFPTIIMQIRNSELRDMEQEDFNKLLRSLHGQNWRYWVYVFPVVVLPRLAARGWWIGTQSMNRAGRALRLILSYPQWKRCMIRPQVLG